MALHSFNDRSGSMVTCGPTNAIFSLGFASFILVTSLMSPGKPGVEVNSTRNSYCLPSSIVSSADTWCGGASSSREPSSMPAGYASQTGYQYDSISRVAGQRELAPPSKFSNEGGLRRRVFRGLSIPMILPFRQYFVAETCFVPPGTACNSFSQSLIWPKARKRLSRAFVRFSSDSSESAYFCRSSIRASCSWLGENLVCPAAPAPLPVCNCVCSVFRSSAASCCFRLETSACACNSLSVPVSSAICTSFCPQPAPPRPSPAAHLRQTPAPS